jgi:sec-independent protein translocase protein TatA
MTAPFIANLGPTELLIILAIVVLLFGASKLPELARGSGRALRIFKAETKGLTDDDATTTPEQREIEARNAESERIARQHRDDTTA